MSDTGIYFYAISRGLDAEHVRTAVGINQAPLRLVEHEDLCAVVSSVDLDEFGEEGLRRNLEDLAWLESVAVAHDRVARLATEHAATAPLRLATVFLTDEAVRSQLAQWHDRAEQVLDRIEGRSEWSVKAYADEPAAVTADPDPPAEPGMGEGKAYLLRRRTEAQRREQTAHADADTAEALHAALDERSVMSRRLPPQDKRLTGHRGEMILNGTYLVDQDQVAAFQETVAALASRDDHIRVERGGPWPPYSFATLETQ